MRLTAQSSNMPLEMNTVNKYFAMTWENLMGQPLNGKGSQRKAQELNTEMTTGKDTALAVRTEKELERETATRKWKI